MADMIAALGGSSAILLGVIGFAWGAGVVRWAMQQLSGPRGLLNDPEGRR